MANAPARSLEISHVHSLSAKVAGASQSDVPQQDRETSIAPEGVDWQAEAKRLRTALEDVVALAGANAEATGRIIQMQRRARAALSGLDR